MRKLASQKRYYEKNLDRLRVDARERKKLTRKEDWEARKRRYLTDPVFNLEIKIRRRIHMGLRNRFTGKIKKAGSTISLLGCTYAEFKEYITGLMTEGMTWDDVFNGRVHLDHVKPLKCFDLSDPYQQLVAFNYRNMQPLWAQDNWEKNARWSDEDLDWSKSFAPFFTPDAQEAARFYAEGDPLLTAEAWSHENLAQQATEDVD